MVIANVLEPALLRRAVYVDATVAEMLHERVQRLWQLMLLDGREVVEQHFTAGYEPDRVLSGNSPIGDKTRRVLWREPRDRLPGVPPSTPSQGIAAPATPLKSSSHAS